MWADQKVERGNPAKPTFSDRAVYRAVRNYLKNEVVGKVAAQEGKGGLTWLREQIIESVRETMARIGGDSAIRAAIREEIGNVMTRWGGEKAFKARIEQIIREETQAYLKANLKVSASLELDVNPKRYEGEATF